MWCTSRILAPATGRAAATAGTCRHRVSAPMASTTNRWLSTLQTCTPSLCSWVVEGPVSLTDPALTTTTSSSKTTNVKNIIFIHTSPCTSGTANPKTFGTCFPSIQESSVGTGVGGTLQIRSAPDASPHQTLVRTRTPPAAEKPGAQALRGRGAEIGGGSCQTSTASFVATASATVNPLNVETAGLLHSRRQQQQQQQPTLESHGLQVWIVEITDWECCTAVNNSSSSRPWNDMDDGAGQPAKAVQIVTVLHSRWQRWKPTTERLELQLKVVVRTVTVWCCHGQQQMPTPQRQEL